MTDYKTYSDQELFEDLKVEKMYAFTQIYNRYFAILYRHAYQMLRDKVKSEDVVHDVFQLLLEKRCELDLQHSLKGFLYAMVRFRILKQLRHDKVVSKYLDKLTPLEIEGINSIDLYLDEKEFSSRLEQSLSKLPPKMREVFELSRIDELSYSEIANVLKISEHTVKRQISNALKIMRDTLKCSFLLFF